MMEANKWFCCVRSVRVGDFSAPANIHMENEGSFAWGGYYGTTYWADPKEKMVCLIMTQHTPNSHRDYIEKITNVIYGSLK